MTFRWKAGIALFIVGLIVALALLVNHYRDNAITFKDQRDKATENLSLANNTIDDMKVRQRDARTGCQVHEGISRCKS